MNDKNIKLISALVIVYIIAYAIFHNTYNYTAYWEEEDTVAIRYSLIYFVIALGICLAFNTKGITQFFSKITLKKATLYAAYAGAVKAALCLLALLNTYIDETDTFLTLLAWAVISAFFFTLHKEYPAESKEPATENVEIKVTKPLKLKKYKLKKTN